MKSDGKRSMLRLAAGGLGPGSWRRPSLVEPRTLLRGCPATESGGACGVTDACVDGCWSDACAGRAEHVGPGPDGCDGPDDLTGTCFWYWSSLPDPRFPSDAWLVFFHSGYAHLTSRESLLYVRCVRLGR